MYNFKVINIGIPEKKFNELCFFAVSEAKFKLPNSSYSIPTELKHGVFCCNGNGSENLEVLSAIEHSFSSKRYVKGRDYTINVLMEN